MTDEPLILEANFLNDESTISSDYGGTVANLFERDVENEWVSSGANSDATAAILIIEFNEDGIPVSKTIDTVVMLNHNIKHAVFEYWDGDSWEAWFEWTDMVSNYGMCPDMCMSLDDWESVPQPSTTKVRITMTSTSTANAEKSIGELIFTKELIVPADGMTSYQVRSRQKAKTLLLGDNSIQQVVTKWSTNRSQKYEATVAFSQVSAATWELFRQLKESGDDFLWYPEPSAAPEEIYWVIWTSPLPKKYAALYKGAGIDVQLDLKEI